ncbi:flavoprotein [Maledivibacter halophilus]|uniref:Ethanolamine utilization protein n=1 Tax=Maledivibacter halophilus TaxID=36842 RepID=A0A1T5JUF7_9FIRM|nr:flavoprotein [Maledivibacter halophilus]SKC55007.1 ethanolamine utilization protein [Maledivibacter halophilus]
MSNKDLIIKVLGDITTRINNQSIEPKKYSKVEKDNILVLFTGSNLEIDKVLDNLKKLIENGCLLTLCFSKNAEEVIDVERITGLLSPHRIYFEHDKERCLEIVQSSDIVLVPALTQNTLAKVAVGIQDSFISMLLWQLLWAGKKVFVNKNSAWGRKQMSCKSKKMLDLMNSHMEILKEFGVKIIEEHDYQACIGKETGIYEDRKNEFAKREKADLKKVITERDILDLVGKTGEFTVSRGTIITPLAKDVAKENKIRIILR